MIRRWLSAVAVVTIVIGQAAVAAAHARFDHSTPNPGQVVQTNPPRVDIYTAQDMRKLAGANDIMVTGSDGARVDDGTTVVDDSDRRHFSVGLKGNLPPGRYVVSFKTLSDEDGENDQGAFAFYVGTPPTDAQRAADQKLTLTSKSEETESASHTGLYIGIAVVVAVLLVAGIGGLTWWRRRAAV